MNKFFIVSSVFYFFMSIASHASDVSEIEKLTNKSEYDSALRLANQTLEYDHNNTKVAIIKANILVKLGKLEKATKFYKQNRQLLNQNPKFLLSLAKLNEKKENYETAIELLNTAIKKHPKISLAHEQLGDLYLAISKSHYDKGVRSGDNNDRLKFKQNSLHNFNDSIANYSPNDEAPASSNVTKIIKTDSDTKTTVNNERIETASTNINQLNVKKTKVFVSPKKSKQNSPSNGLTNKIAQNTKKDAPQVNEQAKIIYKDILQFVNSWRDSWSSKDIKKYLTHYSTEFIPPDSQDTRSWINHKKKVFNKSKSINVNVDDIAIDLKDTTNAQVTFNQKYQSDDFQDYKRKLIKLKFFEHRWLIINEQELNGEINKQLASSTSTAMTPKTQKTADVTQSVAKSTIVITSELKDQIKSFLSSWVESWSSKDLQRYFGHYSNNFVPPSSASVSNWVNHKKSIFAKANYINVNLTEIEILPIDKSTMSVKFNQRYESSNFRDKSKKVLKLVKPDKNWLILSETEV